MCRHDRDVPREDCLNCDRDKDAFDEWWAANRRDRTPPDIAEEAWFAAIRYLEKEEICF